MLSSRAKYALRAVMTLAETQAAGSWTSAHIVAEQAAIPRKFLEAILVQLRENGFVESRRGAVGGHRLRVPAETLNVADVIRVVDGPIALTPCASRTQPGVCKDCEDIHTCQIAELMRQVRDAAANVLEGCSIAELQRRPELL